MTRATSTNVIGIGLALASLCSASGCERDKRYLDVVFERFDLAADSGDSSEVTDPNLVNPIGLQLSPGGTFWVANNATGTVTLYQRDGTPLPVEEPLVVQLPVPAGLPQGSRAQATGISYNAGYGLTISSGDLRASARYVMVTREGTILGYSPDVDPTSAVIAIDNSASGAAYRGLSVVPFTSGSRIYATNFKAGKVEVFDQNFAVATDLDPAAFEDLELPSGYAPFGIQRFERRLYVSYAQQDSDGRDPVAGPGKGYIDAYALDGELVGRVASAGELNAPWGMTLAPWSVPYFGGALIVGNGGDGRILAFDLWNLAPLGSLNGADNQTLFVDGLGDLVFGYGRDGYPALFFTAGPNAGQNGVFGMLEPRLLGVDSPD